MDATSLAADDHCPNLPDTQVGVNPIEERQKKAGLLKKTDIIMLHSLTWTSLIMHLYCRHHR